MKKGYELIFFVFIIFNFSCEQTSISQSEDFSACAEVEVLDDENGTSLLTYDQQGRLIKYDNYSLEKFYTDKYIKVKYDDYPVEFILDKKNSVPIFSFSFLENGDGFLETYKFQKGSNLIETITLRGLESAEEATSTEKVLTYEGNNCTLEKWNLKIDNILVQTFEFKNSYNNHKNPFWDNPFQVLLGRGWDVGGFTNQNLPKSQSYVGKSTDSDEFDVVIKGVKTFDYNFDNLGRLKSISIKIDETTTTTRKEDGRTSSSKKEKSQDIAIIYNC